jgi:O-antigen/teichoic acid export membrane protein
LIIKIISHSFWLFIGNSIGRLSMFLTNIIVARVLSQENFGEFSMIRNTISIIEGLVSGTLGSPTVKRVAEVSNGNQQNLNVLIKSLLILNLSISAVLVILIFILSPYIVETFFIGQERMIKGLYIGSIILIATILSGLIQNIFIGREEYRKLAKLSVYTSLISFPLVLIFINSFGLNGALFGVALYFFLDFSIKYLQLKKIDMFSADSIDFQPLLSESKKLLLFSYPLLGSIVLTSFSFWYARVMIVESSGFSTIAIFDAAFQWLTIIMIITGATTSVLLPMFSKNIQKGKEKEFNKILLVNLFVNFIITVLFASIFILFSKEIMSLYGKNYIVGYQVLQILSITAIFFSLSSIMNKVYISKGRIKEIFFVTLISVTCMLLLLKFEIFQGLIGLAYSFMIFYLSNFLLYIFYNLLENKLK